MYPMSVVFSFVHAIIPFILSPGLNISRSIVTSREIHQNILNIRSPAILMSNFKIQEKHIHCLDVI